MTPETVAPISAPTRWSTHAECPRNASLVIGNIGDSEDGNVLLGALDDLERAPRSDQRTNTP
jgi:hypothetical protein